MEITSLTTVEYEMIVVVIFSLFFLLPFNRDNFTTANILYRNPSKEIPK